MPADEPMMAQDGASAEPENEQTRLWNLRHSIRRAAAEAKQQQRRSEALEWLCRHVVPNTPPDGTAAMFRDLMEPQW